MMRKPYYAISANALVTLFKFLNSNPVSSFQACSPTRRSAASWLSSSWEQVEKPVLRAKLSWTAKPKKAIWYRGNLSSSAGLSLVHITLGRKKVRSVRNRPPTTIGLVVAIQVERELLVKLSSEKTHFVKTYKESHTPKSIRDS